MFFLKLCDFSQKYIGDVLKTKYERPFLDTMVTTFSEGASLKISQKWKGKQFFFQSTLVLRYKVEIYNQQFKTTRTENSPVLDLPVIRIKNITW